MNLLLRQLRRSRDDGQDFCDRCHGTIAIGEDELRVEFEMPCGRAVLFFCQRCVRIEPTEQETLEELFLLPLMSMGREKSSPPRGMTTV